MDMSRSQEEFEATDDGQVAKVVMDVIDPKMVTRDMLRQCKIFRTKKSSVTPTRSR